MIRVRKGFIFAWFPVLLILATGSGAQTSPQQQQQPDAAQPSNEILVVGRINPDDLPVKSVKAPNIGQAATQIASEAERFQRCANLPKPADLRKIVDNGPAEPAAQYALHDFIVRNQACYIGYLTGTEAPYFGDCNPYIDSNRQICHAVYDRGALFERVIKSLGDPSQLATAMTIDMPTLERFVQREGTRGVPSDPMDRRYFGIVGCMVGLNPAAAGQLLRSARGSASETRARKILIGYSEKCLGHAVVVKAEPGQFRAYTAEALYNWMAAAANRPSLISG